MNFEFRYRANLRIGGDEWTNRRVEAWRGREKLGHITIAFISRATFDEAFPLVEDYARRIKGIQNPTLDHVEDLFSDYRRFEEFHVETAHVAYVTVEEDHQRQGIATALYIEGARWIGRTERLMLAASTLQRPEVPGLWEKLVADPDVPTVKLHDDRWAIDNI